MRFPLKVNHELFASIGVQIQQASGRINKDCDIDILGGIFSSTGNASIIPFQVVGNLCDRSGNILYTVQDFCSHTLDPIRYEVFHMFCADVSRFVDMDALSFVELFPARV